MARLALVGAVATLSFVRIAAAVPTERTSLNTCQAQVKSAAQTYVDGYIKAVTGCLQAVSKDLIQNSASTPSATTARTCVTSFRMISDSRGAGKSLAEKLLKSIDTKCAPGMPNVTHTLADVLGPGASVDPIDAENIEQWCTNFGGSGSITSLVDWTDCVMMSHGCGAREAIATQYPRAIEWLGLVKPAMMALSPVPATDHTEITDAVAGLTAVVVAMDPGNTGAPNFQCGNNGTCDASLATCTSNLSTCTGSLGTCTSSLATCNAGTAAAGDVLAGKTFSSSAGLGVMGTVPPGANVNGADGAKTFTIPAGLYSGGETATAKDSNLVAANIKSGVTIFGVLGTASVGGSGGLLKTGQTQCDQGTGTLGACPGTPLGQDAAANKGAARSYSDNGDGTITDNATGLMWEKLSHDGSIHEYSTTYTWFTAFTTKVATLNSGSFAGYTDWRLPNRFELESLVDLGRGNPATDPVFNTACVNSCTVLMCSCTQTAGHWSATTYENTPTTAWFVSFGDGFIGASAKTSNAFSVRAVRGGS